MTYQTHQTVSTLKQIVNYPAHPPRRPTTLFKKNRKKLVFEMDLPCIKCGVRDSILKDAIKSLDPLFNPKGSTQIELHHWIVEDSLANAIDPDKWNKDLRPYLLQRHPDAGYDKEWSSKQILSWVHGHEHNLMVLCDKCHRHPLIGIHAITHPIWNVQNLIKDQYDLTGYIPTTPHEGIQLENLPQTVGKVTSDPAIDNPEHV